MRARAPERDGAGDDLLAIRRDPVGRDDSRVLLDPHGCDSSWVGANHDHAGALNAGMAQAGRRRFVGVSIGRLLLSDALVRTP